MHSWYVVRTKPNREFVVREQLVTRGIETFLPVWKPVESNSLDKKLRAYFPCYLFANVDLHETSLSSLVYLPGVNHLIMCDGIPVRVEQSIIDSIAARICALEQSVPDRRGKPLLHGDRVSIAEGAFEGYEAIFDRYVPSSDRVRLLIDFLQRRTPLVIERRMIQKN